MRIFTAALLSSAFAIPASSQLIISEVVDAPLPGGLPKFVELTNTSADPIDLSAYSIGNFNNGNLALGGSGVSTALAGTIDAGDSFVISYENGDEPGVGLFFDTYGFDPDFFELGAFFNGDDVIALFEGEASTDENDVLTGTIVDIYGEIGVDGTATAWEYVDSYSFRNADVTSPSDSWVEAEWTYGGADALETGDDVTELELILEFTTPGTHEFDGGTGGLCSDFNGDGVVDLLDLDILGANWQMAGTATTGDATGDGMVDLLDLDKLGSEWQQTGSFAEALAASGIVPEPASAMLLAAGSLAMMRRRR